MSPRTNHRTRALALAALIALGAGLTACSTGNSSGAGSRSGTGAAAMQVSADGSTNMSGSVLQTQLDALPDPALTQTEQAGLLRMREEELLAHDVYIALGNVWHLQVFTNISAAEQTHTNAVKTLLDRHAITDPAATHVAGQFTDPDLQALYTDLVTQGRTSLVAALTVGATIEDLDIADLHARATTTADIALVYANLEKGSRNHMRAFTKQLTNNRATYTPTHITQTAYDAIVTGDIERGPAG